MHTFYSVIHWGDSPRGTGHTSVPASPLRSYQMPVRDEESESQRKARSRLMRQARRSTQVRAWTGPCALGCEGGGLAQSSLIVLSARV